MEHLSEAIGMQVTSQGKTAVNLNSLKVKPVKTLDKSNEFDLGILGIDQSLETCSCYFFNYCKERIGRVVFQILKSQTLKKIKIKKVKCPIHSIEEP